ncbi:MAG: L-sorbosone dehydrogenase, partial [Chloroflexi bacterium]|nr:L-sorbosone dehydrogenase [Chloroflexota bacterium]
ESDARRAAILRFGADGSGGMRFASGLRNAVGLALNPRTGQLWATVNERDNQGNEIPPDLVTAVNEGDDFGWPSCQPPDARPQSPGASCAAITPPTVGIQAHSAPLGLTFVAGGQFPFEYQNDLIVAQHGSWNREPPAAPKLLRIHFENGQPVSAEDFAAGWQGPDGGRWGRPAGVIAAPDGSLVVSDDTAGLIYRISYTG